MEDGAQTIRSHMQRVVSLLNLHIQNPEDSRAPDFADKLRMRMALMAEALPIAIGVEPRATMRAAFEAIERIVAPIYDPDGRIACDYAIEERAIDASTLATVGQIFAEFLSNIYARAADGASCRTAVKVSFDAAGAGVLSVRQLGRKNGAQAEPLDQLTSRVIGELARSIDGEARFDREYVGDAQLTFPVVAPAGLGGG